MTKSLRVGMVLILLMLGSATASAAATKDNADKIEHIQKELKKLQKQLDQLKNVQKKRAALEKAQKKALAGYEHPRIFPRKITPGRSLSFSGGAVAEYYKIHKDAGRPGGDLNFDFFQLGVSGSYNNWHFGVEERFGGDTIAGNHRFLHFAKASYDFGANKNQTIIGGFFSVPFGNSGFGIDTLGYQSFWGSYVYSLGYTDNQAAGLGYRYQANAWRFDLDAFKNDDFDQDNTYGGNPFGDYQRINGGNARLAYTFNHGENYPVTLSIAARGGELEVSKDKTQSVRTPTVDANGNIDSGNITRRTETLGSRTEHGTRWAATVAADAKLGHWRLQGQFIDYQYNIPQVFAGETTQSLVFGYYGFADADRTPAKGQIYSFNVARSFAVNVGVLDKLELYNNFTYLHSGYGEHDDQGNRIGDTQSNEVGAEVVMGPVYLWADWITGRNATATFNGPSDGDWHNRFNLAAAFYFNGELIPSSDSD